MAQWEKGGETVDTHTWRPSAHALLTSPEEQPARLQGGGVTEPSRSPVGGIEGRWAYSWSMYQGGLKRGLLG